MTAPSALRFALLIGADEALTEEMVNEAHRAAVAAYRRRDDIEAPEALPGDVVASRNDVEPVTEDDIARALAGPVEGSLIVRPVRPVDAGALAAAAERFVTFTGRLPRLSGWADLQAVHNMLPGERPEPTPMTDCSTEHESRN